MEDKFNEQMRQRTKAFAVRVLKMYPKLPKREEVKIIGKQLLRSATSVGANFRATTRARSEAEYFAKLSIVVEEADETLFWFEILEEAELIEKEKLTEIKKEATEIVKILAATRKKLKS